MPWASFTVRVLSLKPTTTPAAGGAGRTAPAGGADWARAEPARPAAPSPRARAARRIFRIETPGDGSKPWAACAGDGWDEGRRGRSGARRTALAAIRSGL